MGESNVLSSHIGIWKLKQDKKGAYFIRNPALYKEYSEWAWTLTFQLKKTSKRIVYIGDSVGMGYYYKPFFTPSIYLQEILSYCQQKTEVIDLSKKDLDYCQFKELVISATTLEVDMFLLLPGEELWKGVLNNNEDDLLLNQAIRKIAVFLEKIFNFMKIVKAEYYTDIIFVLPGQKSNPWSKEDVRRIASLLACQNQIKLLDLNEVFQDMESDPKEGYFLDDFHMSALGIQKAMKHIAAHLAPLNGSADMEMKIKNFKYDFNGQKNKVLGRAYMLAAIECGQKASQPYQVLFHHCRRAISYWPEAIRCFELYLEMVTSGIPWYLHRNYTELSKFDLWPVFPGKNQLIGDTMMQIDLVNAIVNALKGIDIDLCEKVGKDWMEGYGPINGRINLLADCYRKPKPIQHEYSSGLEKLPTPGYYTATERRTEFYLPADGQADIRLKLTISTPAAGPGKASVQILLDQLQGIQLMAAGEWSDFIILIPKEMLRTNKIHSLVIVWPERKKVPNKSSAETDGEEGLMPVYGRIFGCEAVIMNINETL